jgi:hypothetical protein
VYQGRAVKRRIAIRTSWVMDTNSLREMAS